MALREKVKELFGEEGFSFDTVFGEIDFKATGFIEFKSLIDFFKKNSIFPYDEEIISLLHRFDSDGDGRLTLSDVQNFLKLSNPSKSSKSSQRASKVDLIEIDKDSIDKIHEAATNVLLKSMDFRKEKEKEKEKENLQDFEGTPPKKSLSKYDYYPYEAVRKFNSPNSPDRFASPKREGSLNASQNPKRDSSLIASKYGPRESAAVNKLTNDLKSRVDLVDLTKNGKEERERENSLRKQPFSNPADQNQSQESEAIKSIINDNEQKDAFWKEVCNSSQEITKKLRVSGPNSEILQKILDYFVKLIKTQEKIEELKDSLLKKSDFNLIDFFGFFDKNKKGFCTIQEFKSTLLEQDNEFEEYELDILLSKLDHKKTQKIRFVDFEKIMTTHGYRETDRKPINVLAFNFKYRELFSFETRKMVTKLISTQFSLKNNSKR